MPADPPPVRRRTHTLAVNAGSSNTKLAVFEDAAGAPRPVLRARLQNAQAGGVLEAWDARGRPLPGPKLPGRREAGVPAVADVLEWFEDRLGAPIDAVGHRVVHGGPQFAEAVRMTDDTIGALADLEPLAPLHQRRSLAAASAIRGRRPDLPQAFAFDTVFHRGHDPLVDRLGLPRAFEAQGLRRFGFHGLSYEYVAGRLRELDPPVAAGRVIAAHLGSGASLCALEAGRSRDTSMGATPLDGLLMGTRCGSLDPGVILFLLQTQGLDGRQLSDLLYHQSGLLGVSGLSADMRVLLESREPAAREAVDLFVFRVAREAAALAGGLGGLDGLVFTAGIGEACPEIRAAVCKRLAWLGVAIDAPANRRGDAKISTPASRVAVWVIPTDEERMIAVHTREALGASNPRALRPDVAERLP